MTMVVNLCLQHFQTTAHSNKLCADGCDVSNLLSGDPVARRRGFRLEYFLRPPFHVTLQFQVRVELCRVDVELWPCGLDQGSVSRKIEISTCSDFASKTSERSQQTGQFKLVGCCVLREEVLACFKHLNFKHRAPFPEPPPQSPAQAKQFELWSRGLQSLSSVAQLRVTVPYGGAASALGIKSLAVWGIPARCCPPHQLENFQKAHFESLKPKTPSLPLVLPPSTSSRSLESNPALSETSIPAEFLDPLTQELMVLPMILPSGMVVDSSTLEEYQKQEAIWGRLPNDPFTGVAFTKDCKPLPNPLLKSRIDSLMLQIGCTRVGSTNGLLNKPQPSKLTNPSRPSCSAESFHNSHAGPDDTEIQSASSEELQKDSVNRDKNQSRISGSKTPSGSRVERQSFRLESVTETHSIKTENMRLGTKRKHQSDRSASTHWTFTSSHPQPLTKIPKTDSRLIFPTETHSSQSSHEQRLSDSLDQALSSALSGLPTYTSQSKVELETTPGQARCGSCSCSLTVYSVSPLAYSLSCGHLLCRSCLHRERPASSPRLPVTCPTCKACTSPSTITRVHH